MSRFNMAFIVAVFLLNSHLSDAKTTKKGIPVTTTSANPIVLIETNKGPIEIELWEDKAPITVKNFLTYVDENFYDGTVFHRVIPKFMIQGGGMTADMKEKSTHAPIKNEASKELLNKKGTLAMARTSDINSASSQFFINLVDNGFLDHTGTGPQTFGYAVFGTVTKGMETVDAIAKVTTGNSGYHQDVPQEAVVIKSARRK
jgi:peptidyl-prolyl cis-trans isomerase A (cyclophilin A)